MKTFIFLSFLVFDIQIYSQISLKDSLWSRVSGCYSQFEDIDDDSVLDMSSVVDDSKNGYFQVSGGWPTCGCGCTSTVGAYKKANGTYIFLQYEEYNCDWLNAFSASTGLSEVLPKDFGIKTFIPGYVSMGRLEKAYFYLNVEIPRVGTDTKVELKLIPLGLEADAATELLAFGFSERASVHTHITGISDIARNMKDPHTIDLLLSGSVSSIVAEDKKLVSENVRTDQDDASRFISTEELILNLRKLKSIYEVYNKIEYTSVLLGWNKTEGRFFIKEKIKNPKKVSFIEFLKESEYWSWMC